MRPNIQPPEKPDGQLSTLKGPLLDIGAVALALGTTRRHVQRLVAERRIPFLKVGRFVRFDQDEISGWLEEQRVEMQRPLCRVRHR
jgi:excisionase family DNA binding protein